MTRALLALLLSGCGRLHFEEPPHADAGSCPWGPFSGPVRLSGAVNTDDDEWSPAPSAGDLVMYYYTFAPGGPGQSDVWRARRSSASAAFDAGAPIAAVSSPLDDRHPRPTADELLLFLVSNRNGLDSNVYVASRPSVAVELSAPVEVGELNSAEDEDGIAVSPDGLAIVVSSDRAGNVDLYAAARLDRTQPFGALAPIVELNSAAAENTPALSSDELELFFISDRAGGAGGTDLYRAVRASRGEPFGSVENLGVLNSARDEYAPALSADGTRLYFAYDTSIAGDATADIWVATRSCL